MHLLTNIDSALASPANIDRWKIYADRYIGFLTHTWNRTPVYLINPYAMDEIYPLKRRMLLNEECLKEHYYSRRNREYNNDRRRHHPEELDRLFKRLQECVRVSDMVVWGVYFRSGNKMYPEAKYPCIFICPERILESAAAELNETMHKMKLDKALDILFAKVLYHELAHAFMDKADKPDEFWSRIIEESLANAIAWSRFRSSGHLWLVNRSINGQPLEYKASTFWQEYNSASIRDIAKKWANYDLNEPHMNSFDPFLITILSGFQNPKIPDHRYWRKFHMLIEEYHYLFHRYVRDYIENPSNLWMLLTDHILKEMNQ